MMIKGQKSITVYSRGDTFNINRLTFSLLVFVPLFCFVLVFSSFVFSSFAFSVSLSCSSNDRRDDESESSFFSTTGAFSFSCIR